MCVTISARQEFNHLAYTYQAVFSQSRSPLLLPKSPTCVYRLLPIPSTLQLPPVKVKSYPPNLREKKRVTTVRCPRHYEVTGVRLLHGH